MHHAVQHALFFAALLHARAYAHPHLFGGVCVQVWSLQNVAGHWRTK
jgi:ABC-type uncharacterized transport system substrate-binding protein